MNLFLVSAKAYLPRTSTLYSFNYTNNSSKQVTGAYGERDVFTSHLFGFGFIVVKELIQHS